MLFFNLGTKELNTDEGCYTVTPRAVICKTLTKEWTKQATFERNLYVWEVSYDGSFNSDVIRSPLGYKTLEEVLNDLKAFNNIMRFTASGQAIYKPKLKQPKGAIKCHQCKFLNKSPLFCAVNPTGIYLDHCNDREV